MYVAGVVSLGDSVDPNSSVVAVCVPSVIATRWRSCSLTDMREYTDPVLAGEPGMRLPGPRSCGLYNNSRGDSEAGEEKMVLGGRERALTKVVDFPPGVVGLREDLDEWNGVLLAVAYESLVDR